MTGLVGSNDEAVAFLRERQSSGLDVGLIGDALECRRAAANPDALFPARTILPFQIDACASLLADWACQGVQATRLSPKTAA
jgi:hypothetical protein